MGFTLRRTEYPDIVRFRKAGYLGTECTFNWQSPTDVFITLCEALVEWFPSSAVCYGNFLKVGNGNMSKGQKQVHKYIVLTLDMNRNAIWFISQKNASRMLCRTLCMEEHLPFCLKSLDGLHCVAYSHWRLGRNGQDVVLSSVSAFFFKKTIMITASFSSFIKCKWLPVLLFI